MAAPIGIPTSRWNQAVNALSRSTGSTSAEVDAWLNAVWVGMYVDELQGHADWRAELEKWLVANGQADAPTLPVAFQRWATA